MTDRVRFFVDGKYHEVVDPVPTITVLEYLRETCGITSSKEGCAEGDCGACTVVLAELRGDGFQLRSVNACIRFLPTVDGKALITAAGLIDADGYLHPAQQALVDCHGSQCGFCTPGFVMSLFALFKSDPQPDREAINHALSGNLCRCTGYRPIIDAARKMYELAEGSSDDWMRLPGASNNEPHLPGEQKLLEQLNSIQRSDTLRLGNKYHAPVAVDELANLIARHPQATLLSGGTDVGLWVTKDFRDLDHVIYLGDVKDLQEICVADTEIEIGAGVNLTDAFACLSGEYPGLGEVIRRYASPPVCNAGTLAGNVANGSPIGDSMPALMCLDTRLVLRRGSDLRETDLDGFYLDYQKTDLLPGEFIVALRIPRSRPGRIVQSYKIGKRFDQDISAVCAAFHLVLDNGRVAHIRVCYGGMAATPLRARHVERTLAGQPWTRETVEAAMLALDQDYSPISDMRASAGYRRNVAANLLLKFFHETKESHQETRVFALEPEPS